ncbi:transglycosylase domain-containing protein [Mucilaginibacter sabulilitoris]|uniref:Transglycosylase domain-containing protein n=1 Tax=Mucilaginibacter sabulilitoris TaxID=1173583 RepID=A0ABZ0TNL4_9SPHI|nr:transglycosylase domain-containing protein [Mucilaginibacter sabulilitoris]WPU94381.1 transglycosylase domain-containing protein [Mucilaginibacter sabulilitoris]
MKRLNPKYIRIAAFILIPLLLIFLIGGYTAYSKREALLQKAIDKAKAKAKRDYNLDVKIGSAHFTGTSTVSFSDICIVPENRDSLLNIKNLVISVKLLPLAVGDIKLADVLLQDGFIHLTSVKGVRNFDFLFKKKKDSTATRTKVDLSELANHLVNEVLYKIPDNLALSNFSISFKDDTNQIKLLTKTALIKDGNLTSTIDVNNGYATWHMAGKMHPSDKDIDVKLYADGKKVELPIIEKKFKLKLNFDTISTRLTRVEHSSGLTKIYGSWAVNNLLINHPGISSENIVFPNASIDANVFVGENYVSVDSSSLIHIKKLTARPFIKYTLNPVKIYELKINTGWLNATDIFEAFPSGMFDALNGIQVAGKLNYALNFYMDASKIDDLQFDSRLSKDNFRIIKYGKTDLSKLNSTFIHTPYEKGKPMSPHLIGPDNPEFTPLNEIAPSLRNAVMTAEDPSFYTNHGFVEEAFRKSLVTDFKTKKFKRGGSGISMQLVKNAFLSREKTLARKIEEILIVWIIENNRIMNKNRMLEVYLNIIEWGRGIYGISEASHYYFGKSPSELTLGESIYLASIVPYPKGGLYAFQPDGTLRPGLHGYFNLIGRLMASKGYTQRDTNAYGFYNVRLRESLRRAIAPVDTATADSLMKQSDDYEILPVLEDPVKKPNFLQRLFGKKDTTGKAEGDKEKQKEKTAKEKLNEQIDALKQEYKLKIDNIDTAGKTRKEIRQEKRRLKKEQNDKEDELKEKANL